VTRSQRSAISVEDRLNTLSEALFHRIWIDTNLVMHTKFK